MGLLILCIVVAALCSVGTYFIEKRNYADAISIGLFAIAVVCWFAFIIMAGVFVTTYCTIDGYVADNQQIYDSLSYQVENKFYENANGVGKYELCEAITNWNADLARGKAMRDNFWLGAFYPDSLYDFDFIALPDSGG